MMEAYSSWEEVVVKTRKPYTITKQRERWTEDEHNRFLEALKLYGRAWQRIEEHIGTKTAVQIRSHAQKFFAKLEKEALMKGIPMGQALDIEIPPPRPKRKPSNPYPRKTSTGLLSSVEGKDDIASKSVSSLSTSMQVLGIDNSAPIKESINIGKQLRKDAIDDCSRSEVHDFFQDAPSTSSSPPRNFLSRPHQLKEALLTNKEIKVKNESTKSFLALEGDKELKSGDKGNNGLDINHANGPSMGSEPLYVQNEEQNIQKNPIESYPTKDDLNSFQNHSRSVSAHFSDSSGDCMQTAVYDGNIHLSVNNKGGDCPKVNLFNNLPFCTMPQFQPDSIMSSILHSSIPFPPFNQVQSSEDIYKSLTSMSSTFSSLILSTLLQNPAVHAAATLAASFWPTSESSVTDPLETTPGGFDFRNMNPSASLATIAAVTVAAASAWWATHGLLLFNPPFHFGCPFTPPTEFPAVDVSRVSEATNELKDGKLKHATEDNLQVVAEHSEAPRAGPTSKTVSCSSSDSEEGGQCEIKNSTEQKSSMGNKIISQSDDRLDDPGISPSKRKLDRSSCGSNTPSSCELDMSNLNEIHDEQLEEPKDAYPENPVPAETSTRRTKSTGNFSDSWKEVSEEGRLAFQALFTREVLPQSFSPSHGKVETTPLLPIDINSKTFPETEAPQSERTLMTNDENSGKVLPLVRSCMKR